jgi:formyl-CoA transferase
MAALPPEFGEHSDEILLEFGFGEDEIAELKQQKVV